MKPEPTTRETAAYVGMKVAEWAGYGILLVAAALFWAGTP